MPKFRIFYIVSLVILGVLVVTTVFQPMASHAKYSEVQRAQLVKAGDEWILQFDILNHEGKDTDYTIDSTVSGKPYVQFVTVRDAGMFTYIQHIRPDELSERSLSFAVYKEGEDTPFEQAIYHF